MSKLRLSVAVGDYDRMRPLFDGDARIDGVDPVFMRLEPEEIFFRAFRHAEFDVCELSLSSFAVTAARGDGPYVGIPVYPSRAFRHTSIVVRKDRGIAGPAELRGRRLGTPEYQLTACVWARALLEEEYGVRGADITWVRGGLEQPGRVEKIKLALPPDIRLEDAPPDTSLSTLLERGDIDGIVAPRLPAAFARGDSRLGWLFDDPMEEAAAWFRRTRIFPIMHLLGLRRSIADQHPWLPAALLKAFERSKQIAMARLSDTAATKVTLPFVEEQLVKVRALMGEDFWPYGVDANRHTLETFLRHHHRQGLSRRQVAVEELFHPATLETFRV
jgi:4,5-dihydroxyphthalate decarboxylase